MKGLRTEVDKLKFFNDHLQTQLRRCSKFLLIKKGEIKISGRYYFIYKTVWQTYDNTLCSSRLIKLRIAPYIKQPLLKTSGHIQQGLQIAHLWPHSQKHVQENNSKPKSTFKTKMCLYRVCFSFLFFFNSNI